jgi:hypothetical protein
LFSGEYADLKNKPLLFDGKYTSLTEVPVPFSKNYNDLTNKPILFDGNYASLKGLPTLFSGSWNNLTDKPTLFNGAYSSLSGKPALFSGNYNDLSNLPALFSGQWNDISNKPVFFSGNYADLAGKPVLFSGKYTDLTNTPALFSGNYNDLTNKPTIPNSTTNISEGTNLYYTAARVKAYLDSKSIKDAKYYEVTTDANGNWALDVSSFFSYVDFIAPLVLSPTAATPVVTDQKVAHVTSYTTAGVIKGTVTKTNMIVSLLITGSPGMVFGGVSTVKVKVEGTLK